MATGSQTRESECKNGNGESTRKSSGSHGNGESTRKSSGSHGKELKDGKSSHGKEQRYGKSSHGKEQKDGKSSQGKELKNGKSSNGKEPKCGKGSQGNGQSGPKMGRHAGKTRGPRESRPEIGKPGGIYGPGGSQLPVHVFYRANKQRYQARVRRVDGKHHRDLADAVAEAIALCGEPA
jgi:hypothetical protein